MKKAGAILKTILGNNEALRGETWTTFFRGWTAVAGEDIAAHSQVKDVVRGSVLVEVDHPGWLQMLQLKKNIILTKMQKAFPELGIVDIRCFVGSRQPENENNKQSGSMDNSHTVDNQSQEYKEFKSLLTRLRKHAEE